MLKLLKPVLYVLLPGEFRTNVVVSCSLPLATLQLETVVLFGLVSLLTEAVLLHITYYMVASVCCLIMIMLFSAQYEP